MERVLVTGGAGFIGSHVVDKLRARGLAVTVYDRYAPEIYRDDLRIIIGDVKDRTKLMNAIAEHDGVIHLAAILGTQETVKTAGVVVKVNILGSLSVFDACKQHGVRGVYIAVGNHWMNNPYSITKTAAERFALMYNREFGTKIAVVRGLNAYGPRQKAKPVRKVVPNFVLPALKGEEIVVYGSGNQIMDVVYVEDVAEILVRALVMDHGVYDRIIEAGMGLDTTINELAAVVLRETDSTSSIRHVPMRPGEIPDSVVKADVETMRCLGLAREDLTSIDEGIRRTIDYYRTKLKATR
jgi:UDP-glucose 4-epimerase